MVEDEADNLTAIAFSFQIQVSYSANMETRFTIKYYNPPIHTKGEEKKNMTAEEVLHFFTSIPWKSELKKMLETAIEKGPKGPGFIVVCEKNNYSFTTLCMPNMPSGWSFGYQGLHFRRFLGFTIGKLHNHISDVIMQNLEDVLAGMKIFVQDDYEKLGRFMTKKGSRRPLDMSKFPDGGIQAPEP